MKLLRHLAELAQYAINPYRIITYDLCVPTGRCAAESALVAAIENARHSLVVSAAEPDYFLYNERALQLLQQIESVHEKADVRGYDVRLRALCAPLLGQYFESYGILPCISFQEIDDFLFADERSLISFSDGMAFVQRETDRRGREFLDRFESLYPSDAQEQSYC